MGTRENANTFFLKLARGNTMKSKKKQRRKTWHFISQNKTHHTPWDPLLLTHLPPPQKKIPHKAKIRFKKHKQKLRFLEKRLINCTLISYLHISVRVWNLNCPTAKCVYIEPDTSLITVSIKNKWTR